MTTLIQKAKEFALSVHKDDKYGDYPFFYHLKRAVAVVSQYTDDEVVIAATWLHDTIEHKHATHAVILFLFGKQVAETVDAVTDEEGVNRKERKLKTYPKTARSFKGSIVKLADRIANVETSTDDSSIEKLEMYVQEHHKFMGHAINLKVFAHPIAKRYSKSIESAINILNQKEEA